MKRYMEKGQGVFREEYGCCKRYMDASITVEAVFIIPFVMLLLLAFLWLSFHIHDKSVIEGALFQTMEEGGEYLVYGVLPGTGIMGGEGGSKNSLHYAVAQPEEEEVRLWEERFYKEIEGKLFLYRPEELCCEKTMLGTKVYAKFCCTEFFPAKYFGFAKLFCMEYDCDRCCPVREEVTRAGSVLLDIFRND